MIMMIIIININILWQCCGRIWRLGQNREVVVTKVLVVLLLLLLYSMSLPSVTALCFACLCQGFFFLLFFYATAIRNCPVQRPYLPR
jgi:hypothetical protein